MTRRCAARRWRPLNGIRGTAARAARTVLTFALLSTLLAATGGTASATARAIVVSPASGLVDQVVDVHWTGFHPTDPSGAFTVTLFQCKGAVPRSVSDCYQVLKPPSGPNEGTGVYDGTTAADGTGTASIEVRPAQDLPVLDCTSTNPCSVLAFENDGSRLPRTGLPVSAATAPIRFAPSPADCPPTSSSDVRTDGSASTSHALYTWAAQVCTGSRPLALDYTEISSPAGRRDFLNGSVDVGLSSSPVTPDEMAASPAHRTYAYAPIDVTGVAVAFSVTDTLTHQRITDMNLSPRLVAILVAGSGLHLFQDPEFVALNPGHSWPMEVQPPLLRAERNADALLLTGWLEADHAARAFLDGNDPTVAVDQFWRGIAYPTDIFEARDPNTLGNYNPRSGTIANARRLFNFQPPGDGVSVSTQNDGIMAVLDAVTAKQFGFPVAKLHRANAAPTEAFVAPDSGALAAGYRAMKTNPDGVTRWADVGATNAYPLVKIDYAMVPTSQTTAVKADKIAQFLGYAAGPGQVPGRLPLGYLPMPPDLAAQTTAARDAVVSGATPPPVSPDQPPLANDQPAVVPGGRSAGADTGSSQGSGFDAPTSIAAPSAVAYRAPATRSRGRSGGPLGAAFRALAGSGWRLILPVLLVLGLAAGAAGPVLSARARRGRRHPPTGPTPA